MSAREAARLRDADASGPAAPRPTLGARLRRAAAALHRILGAPDYEAYLAHHARHHAGTPPLSRDEFVRRRQEERYSRPGSRCC